ncbi:MAG: SET domain-containing protein [Planctomycetota bacterium]
MYLDRPALALRSAGAKGYGVFATEAFAPQDLVLVFGGRRLLASAVSDFTHVIQVSAGEFLGPSGEIDDYVNHSCDPNTGLREGNAGSGLELFALRAIEPGEEITFDYSTCIDLEPTWPSCACGSPLCRGRVVAFRDLPPMVRRRYRAQGAVPAFSLASESDVAAGPHRQHLRARRRRSADRK